MKVAPMGGSLRIFFVLSLLAVLSASSCASSLSSIKRCTFPAGFSCYDYYINRDGYVFLDLGQATGRDINITGLGCNTTNQTPGVTVHPAGGVRVYTGSHAQVLNSSTLLQCCENLDEPCRARLTIQYSYGSTPINHTIYGDIGGPLEDVYDNWPEQEIDSGAVYLQFAGATVAFVLMLGAIIATGFKR
ncbi:Uncharacterised protein [uncultured archaeon]|nr:Uncharacterised protein [uncultured archaeon]